jgi:hypothetical protein
MGLSVVVDGVPMAEAEARVFWARFSEHMEKNKGDLAGFAHAEGFASVKPVMTPNGPELVVSRTATQQPYANAARARSSAGSPGAQGRGPKGRENPRKRRGS